MTIKEELKLLQASSVVANFAEKTAATFNVDAAAALALARFAVSKKAKDNAK
jgi:hypothetical protein